MTSLNDLLLNRLTPCAAVAQVCRRQNSASVCRCICRASVCAGRCILRAECPERFLSLLAALTFMEDVACSLYLIWFFTPFRFIVVLKLPSLSQTAVVYFLVRLLHGRVSSWERGSLLYTAPAESGIHSTDSDSKATKFPFVLLVSLKRKFSCYLK